MKKWTPGFCPLLFSTALFAQSSGNVKGFDSSPFYVRGGYGVFQKLAAVDPSVRNSPAEDAINELRNGPFWLVEAGIALGHNLYLGISHSQSSENASFTQRFVTSWGAAIDIPTQVRERIRFTGAHLRQEKSLDRQGRSLLYGRAGVGLFSFHGEASAGNSKEEIRKSNIGYQLGGGYEFRITRNFGLSADLDFLAGNIEYEGEKENLTQVRLGIGTVIRF